MKIEDAVKNVFTKSNVLFKDAVISKEDLLNSYACFLSGTMCKKNHNVGLVMHSGSICFDVVALTIAVLANLISNETSSTEVVESLEIDDIVLYGSNKKGRFIFSGIVDGGVISSDYKGKRYAVLKQNGGSTYVAEASWRLIVPYNGTSQRLDGRGIKKKGSIRDDFFIEVLDYSEKDIPGLIDTSSVLVMSRDKADELIKGISFEFNGKTAKLLDLITASYYSEEDEYSYSGNAGKNEPVIKLCGKVSVARSLILSKKGNNHIGLMVLGQDTINRGQSELPELINRKGLQYVYIITTVDSGYGAEILEENQEIELFACTKDFLTEYGINELRSENQFTQELNSQISNIVHKEVVSEEVTAFPLEWSEYFSFKNNLLKMKRLDYESSSKDEFIVQAHSLMNLFRTAVFSMNIIENAKEQGIIAIDTPKEKMKHLRELVDSLPSSIKSVAESVVEDLVKIYESLKYDTPKEKWLRQYICDHRENRIAIIVPKAYYTTILKDGGMFSSVWLKNITISTAGRFDNGKVFDEIVVIGDFDGKKFDAFRCTSALKIIGLLYPIETRSFSLRKQNVERSDRYLSLRSTIQVKNIKPEENYDYEGVEVIEEVDTEIDEFITSIDSIDYSYSFSGCSTTGKSGMTTEIIAIATFEDERKAFLSKHYKAYVFDSDSGVTKEVGTADLCDGDSIVFTKNNDDTKDIVDSLLRELISAGKLPEGKIEKYRKSKEWQQCLWDYMETNEITMTDVAEKLIKLGVAVQVPTVIRWMDEDAHTVGPRNVESIRAIGKLTGITDMESTPELYFEACREIRGVRRKLLSQIGEAIIGKLSGKHPTQGTLFADIYDRVDDLSEILQIERIIAVERTMPLGIANRPLNMRGE